MLSKLVKYEVSKYFHTNKIVVPLVLLFGFLGMSYSIQPLEILSSFSICALVLFLMMVWIGISYSEIGYEMMDQTVFIKLQKKNNLFIGKIMMVALLSFLISTISMAMPLFLNVRNGFGLFNRRVVVWDVIGGLMLFLFVCMAGGMIGLLLNQYIVKDRKIAVLLGGMIGLITIVKGGIEAEWPLMKMLTWIFPPVYDCSEAFAANTYLQFQTILLPFCWLALYIVILMVLYVFLSNKKRFE